VILLTDHQDESRRIVTTFYPYPEPTPFTNAATANLWFASNILTPWARKVEAKFSRSVFNDLAFHMEVDLSGLVRGDYATRWAANVAAITAKILTADEVRAQKGYGPRPVTEAVPLV